MKRKLCLLVSMMAICSLAACGKKGVDVDTKYKALGAYVEITPMYEETTEETTELTTREVTEATTEEVVDSASNTDAYKADKASGDKKDLGSERYLTCTTRTVAEVEEFAKRVQDQFEHRNLSGLSNYIVFPITIDGVTYKNSFDFVRNDFDRIFDDEFCEAVKNASVENMHCSDIGIRLGDNGEVWINEVVNQESNETMLKVIAIDTNN